MRAVDRPAPLAVEVPVAPQLKAASVDGAGSSIALARLGERRLALVADAEGHAVRMLDTGTGEELPQTDLLGEPSQLVVAPDGRVFVGVRDIAEVDVLEPVGGERPALRVAARIATAEEPAGLSLTPDGRTLLVACGWAHALDAFATRTLDHAWRIDVAREPRAVITSKDGRRAYVAHATSSVVSVVDLMSPDHGTRAVRMEQQDSNGTPAKLAWRQGYALARADMGILAPGVEANTGDTTVRTETYGGVDAFTGPAESFDVAVIDERTAPVARPSGSGAPDEEERAEAEKPHRLGSQSFTDCLLPRAAAYDAGGEWLLVACQGTDTVWRTDLRSGMNARPASWKVEGAPTGVAVEPAERAAYVWSQTTRRVTALPIDAAHSAAAADKEPDLRRTWELGPRVTTEDATAFGRRLFHTTGDPRISSDGRACASCHPDGRDDGLVWATPDGPRQTPSLAGRLAGTAPYGWNGSRSTVKKHVTNTLRRRGGTGLPDEDMNALVAYCMTMKGPPHAAQTEGVAQDAALVAEGADLFDSSATGCSSCHIVDGTFTDGNRHDVKSKGKHDPKRRFDTPSLKDLGSTAPYFHDGRYPTLRALLIGSDGKMGHTRRLSEHQLDALEAYLETL
jgi:cytochrome c peroxidase